MAACDHCGAHVTEDFKRVFSSDNGELRACPKCSNFGQTARTNLKRGKDDD